MTALSGEQSLRFRLCKTGLKILVPHRFGTPWCTGAHVPAGVCSQYTPHISGAFRLLYSGYNLLAWKAEHQSLFNLVKEMALALLRCLVSVLFRQPLYLHGLCCVPLSPSLRSTAASLGLPTPGTAVSHHHHLLIPVGFEVTTRSSEVHCHFKAVAK